MLITDLRVNGIANPLGFSLEKPVFSWKVEDTIAKRIKSTLIEVSLTDDFSSIVFTKKGINLSPLGTTLDFPLTPRTRYYWRVSIQADRKETARSPAAWFETGKIKEPWQANWIACQEKDTYHPEFYTNFRLTQKAVKARLYVTGLGLYQAFINGQKCGNEYLTPNLTDYFSGVEYQTYDVTDLLEEENTLSIATAKGWYMSKIGEEKADCLYGSEMCCLCELRLVMEDGTEEILPTDESWTYTKSDFSETDFFTGEELNKKIRKSAKGKKVCLVESPFPVLNRKSLPVTEVESFTPETIIKVQKESYVLNFETEITGFIEFENNSKAGTKITVEYGKVTPEGNFIKNSQEKGAQTFTYISGGTPEKVHQYFTLNTFSAVKISGLSSEPEKKEIKAVSVYSQMERTGSIYTSSKKINELYENTLQKLKAASIALPAQTFTGKDFSSNTRDAWIQGLHSIYSLDSKCFYEKYIEFLMQEQNRRAGAIPSLLPALQGFPKVSSGWGDIITSLPQKIYETSGSKSLLKSAYPAMKAWADYLRKTDDKTGRTHFLILENQMGDLYASDGLTPDSIKGGTEELFIGTMFYYESILKTAATAQKLKYEWESVKLYHLAMQIRKRIFNEWFTQSGRLALDTQTAYILCLKSGIWKNKAVLIKQFKTRLRQDMYQLKSGTIGLPYALEILCENGMENIAYQHLCNPESPVWKKTPHSAVTFLYSYTGGLSPLEAGYKKALIKPFITMKFREFELTENTPQGKYIVNWNIRDDGNILMHIEIPFGAKAKVILPKCNGKNVEKIKGTGKSIINEKGTGWFKSGTYELLYKPTDDFRYIYSPDTRLAELKEDKEAMKLLQKSLPEVFDSVMKNDAEVLNIPLGEIQSLLKPEADPTDADMTVCQIQSLIRW